ncbi:MAG TPA: DUF4255 domain-containing protein, partial [Urbifossiella sp.]|nr:DUF4255 domain-containing protein [Urbifossiella sp.]
LVTAGHPQVSRGDRTDPQVNLFLYQISPDAKWRNQDVPGKPGTYPLLALRLSYLVTAFGQDDDDRQAHDLLGAVMHRFHTNPIIPRTIADPVVTASGLAAQYEPVRLTLQPLTLNDLSQIWSGSPSPYRLSVGYEASVVLIDSGKAAKAAPPVLGRGTPGDPGFGADPLAGEPTLGGTQFPDGLSGIQPAPAALGTQKWVPDLLTLTGTVLNNPDLRLVFRHPQLGFAYIATPRQPAAGPTQLQVRVPHDLTVYRNQPGQPLGAIEVAANLVPATDPTAWPPGIYTVAAARAVRAGGAPPDRLYTTAPLAFGLLPQVDTTAAPFRVAFVNSTATPPVPTDATMTARLVNPVSLTSGQQVRLFAGGLELLGQVTSADGLALSWEAADPVQLQTDLAAAAAGGEALFLRVQVDGVDSSMLQPLAAGATAPPRAFNPALLVQVS